MPVSVWRDLIDQHYPNTGWVRLRHDTIDALAAYKSRHGLLGFRRRGHVAAGRGDRRGASVSAGWDRARAVADAVLYEGYLLYPYRANSRKNQSRWQFGVLGPDRAAARGLGEEDTHVGPAARRAGSDSTLTLVVRFLQLQRRIAERRHRRR